MSQRALRELDANKKHKQSAKRKKCDSEVQENVSSSSEKKRIRTRPASTANLADRPLKKHATRGKKEEGGAPHTFDRACGGFAPEVLKKEMEKERKVQVDGKYLFQAREVTAQDRLNGLNQIALIHVVEELGADTVFLATSIFDRYLSQTLGMARGEVLKLALASFFLACKHEKFPIILNYHLAKFSLSLSDLLEMEKKVLKTLDWDLSVPTPLNFLRVFAKVGARDENHYFLSRYFLELSHRDSNMLNHYPSKIAAAVMLVSNKMLAKEAWPSDIAEFTGYKEEDLFEPANTLIATLRKEARAFVTNGLPCSPTTTKYDRDIYGDLVPFALSSQIQEDRLLWAPSLPSS